MNPSIRSSLSLARATLDSSSICNQCFKHLLGRRKFSVTRISSSKIGNTPLIIPPSVTLSVYHPPPPKHFTRITQMSTATVSGPLGQITIPIPDYLKITQSKSTSKLDEDPLEIKSTKATVSVLDPEVKAQRQMWGTIRAHLANHILGVTEGHAAIIRFVGVGYRAIIEDGQGRFTKGKKVVNLKLGYSHPILLPVPEGVTASAPVPTRLLLEGINKEVVNLFAASIRKWRVPEPYKGKGIFVNDETIRLKAKKIK